MNMISFSIFPLFPGLSQAGSLPGPPPTGDGSLPDPGSLLPDGVPVLARGPSVETGSMLAPGSFTGAQLGKSAHRLCQTTDRRPDGVAACLPTGLSASLCFCPSGCVRLVVHPMLGALFYFEVNQKGSCASCAWCPLLF